MDETKVLSSYLKSSPSAYAMGKAIVLLLAIRLEVQHQTVHQRIATLLHKTAVVGDVAAPVDKVLQLEGSRQHQTDELHALPYNSPRSPTFRAPRSKEIRS